MHRGTSDGRGIMCGMNVGYAELGFLETGTHVSVDLSRPANVRLMIPECAVLMRFGYGYVFYGGLSAGGTVTLTVPEDDCWVHLVDLAGLSGSVSMSAVRIQRPQRRPLLLA